MAERLGKYTLERKLAAGGMAEVFLATVDGGKSCVIKRMLPSLQIDPQFARMFLDEAKLVVQLNHPAIAQIYDFGHDKGVLYLAMEWVDGTNLRLIIKDFARRKELIPVEYCARLVSQAALALGYAHRAAGLDGKPLKIIHRDVSPQNILLGSTGVVKLIDFGVAKATSSTQVTAAGMIKGKFAYMSPEQLRGDPLDNRSDIFGLGLVLYELLAATRAIPGNSEAEVAQNALAMNFPSIEVKRPDIPPALKAILARALQKDRTKRYDTCEDMAAELETFIMPRMPNLTGGDVAAILPGPDEPTATSGLVPEQVSRARDSDQKLPMKVQAFWENVPPTRETTQMPARSKAAGEGTPARPVIGSGPTEPVAPAPQPIAFTPQNKTFINAPAALPKVEFTPTNKTFINPPGLVPKSVAAAAVAAAGPGMTPTPMGTFGTNPRLRSPPRRLSWFFAAIVIGAVSASLAWRWMQRPAAEPAPQNPLAGAAVIKPGDPVAPPAPANAPEGTAPPHVTFASSIPAKVSVDGTQVGKTPVEMTLQPGSHQIIFEDPAGDTREPRTIELKTGETRTEEWKPARGRVVVRAVPWAEVFVAGKSLGVTPLEPIPMLSGRHTLSFVNGDTGRKDEQVVDVKANADTMVKVDLRPAP